MWRQRPSAGGSTHRHSSQGLPLLGRRAGEDLPYRRGEEGQEGRPYPGADAGREGPGRRSQAQGRRIGYHQACHLCQQHLCEQVG